MTRWICWLLGHALEPLDDQDGYVCIRSSCRGRSHFTVVDGVAYPIEI